MPSSAEPTPTIASVSAASAVAVEPGGPVRGSVRPPGSKSLTNRALLCAALARGSSRLDGALVSEDTEVMIDSLRKIGVVIDAEGGGQTLRISGIGGTTVGQAGDAGSPLELFIANSGTTVRFLSAALSAVGGHYRLTGVPRMHERPIGDLVDALRPVVDGTMEAESPGGCPPVRIRCRGWRAGTVHVAGSVSSQYLSGLLMAAPASRHPATLQVEGELVSRPYVSMTVEVVQAFGAEVQTEARPDVDPSGAGANAGDRFEIRGQYTATDYRIEPDASAASYFWAAAAITGGRVRVDGLDRRALQGDVAFVDVLARMGCTVDETPGESLTVTGGPLRGVDVDMNAISDTVQTLAVVALFAEGPTRVRGVAHNRFKETDRIGDLARELRVLGARIDEHPDGLTIYPLDVCSDGSTERSSRRDASDGLSAAAGAGSDHRGVSSGAGPVRLRTYHDHRMAMSLSLAGLRLPDVWIEDPACTRKTYPDYWYDLERLTGRSHRWAAASEQAGPTRQD